MLPVAQVALTRGEGEAAEEAHPDYVQQRVGWKTLAEQGKRV